MNNKNVETGFKLENKTKCEIIFRYLLTRLTVLNYKTIGSSVGLVR